MIKFRPQVFLLFIILLSPVVSHAQGRARMREYRQVFTTYPYSDPNPVATPGKIYPYFRYERYSDRPVEKEWTVVELENDYIRVLILPEIGGKVWAAIDKGTGRAFIRGAEARAALDRIASFRIRRFDVNSLVSALALRKLGRGEEGAKLLADAIARGRTEPLRDWCVAVYEGKKGSDPGLNDVNFRVVREWAQMKIK